MSSKGHRSSPVDILTAAHLQILQAAIYALFAVAPNKKALRAAFEETSERIHALQLTYAIPDSSLETIRQMRQTLLDSLE